MTNAADSDVTKSPRKEQPVAVPIGLSHLRRGRGALSNASGRFEPQVSVASPVEVGDHWSLEGESSASEKTQWLKDATRSVITTNTSPDIYFDQSVNPYRGCEHGCIYCFARPTHTYLGHSAGLDFERILYAKERAAELLRLELSKPGYTCQPIAIGVNTDAYQPLERKLKLTRQLLTVFDETRHPVFMITKSSLIERDIDLLQSLAADALVSVSVTLTTLDTTLARQLEPRATSPARRLKTLETLSKAGIRTRVSVSPIIPALNEPEIERIIQAAADAGAASASYIVLRLPHELATLFPEWLKAHYPLKAARVLNAIKSLRRDKLYQSDFSNRMSGEGPRADIIRRRFEAACKRFGMPLDKTDRKLNTNVFVRPARPDSTATNAGTSHQLSLF